MKNTLLSLTHSSSKSKLTKPVNQLYRACLAGSRLCLTTSRYSLDLPKHLAWPSRLQLFDCTVHACLCVCLSSWLKLYTLLPSVHFHSRLTVAKTTRATATKKTTKNHHLDKNFPLPSTGRVSPPQISPQPLPFPNHFLSIPSLCTHAHRKHKYAPILVLFSVAFACWLHVDFGRESFLLNLTLVYDRALAWRDHRAYERAGARA